MAHYLLFFPEASGCSPTILERAGLGELLRDNENSPDFMDVDCGPNGKSGVLCTWLNPNTDSNPKFMMHAGQRWVEAPSMSDDLPKGRFWVGVDESEPPQPADLIRSNPVGGLNVTLADGFSWKVPTISRFPNRFQLLEGGEISRVCKEEYAKFYEAGMRVVADLLNQFGMVEEIRDKVEGIEDYSLEVSAKDGLKLIASALSLNYRLNWELCFLLDLLDENTGCRALLVFCELGEIREATVQKKTLKPVSIRVGSYS